MDLISLFKNSIITDYGWLIPVMILFYIFEKSKFGNIILDKYKNQKDNYINSEYKKKMVRLAYHGIRYHLTTKIFEIIIKNDIKNKDRQKVIKLALINKLKQSIAFAIDELVVLELKDSSKLTDHLRSYNDETINILLEPIFEILFMEEKLTALEDTIYSLTENMFITMLSEYLKNSEKIK